MLDRPPIVYRYWWDTMPRPGREWPEEDEFNDLSERALTEQLKTVRFRGPLASEDIPLICVLRNEAARLPLFFEHYKKLGVTRFLMVDNNSDDGSHDILLSEPAADVFFTDTPYKDGQMGVYWYNGLARAHCCGHWTACADADELLVYDGVERHGLSDLARWLERHQLDRFYTLMIDVYPSGAIGSGDEDVAELLETDCWFDHEGYNVKRRVAGLLISGGPRHRVFNQGPEVHGHWLSKYPFFHMTKKIAIFDAHFLWPYDTADRKPMGALIHLKLLHDFIERSKRNELEGQHMQDARAYRIINERLAEKPGTVIFYEKSQRYRGPKSLLRHRLMLPISW